MSATLSIHAENASEPILPDHSRRVVLVHGIFNIGNPFRVMEKRLRSLGADCLVARLNPSDGRGGLERLAVSLKSQIDDSFGPDRPVSIIAFSMGGLVSRHYLQELGGAGRCERLITISTPHNGTATAWLYPSLGASQMRPGSGFLAQLGRSEQRLANIDLVSFRTRFDLIIVPSASSVWPLAENREHPAWIHRGMLTHPRVLREIEERLAAPENGKNR
jgi:triacylglycerol lipase